MVLIYVGTYNRQGSEGIYVYRMDPSSGALELSSKVGGVDNPSFLAIDPQQRYLYAVNEVARSADGSSGAVSAFSIHQQTGELSYLNRQPSHGAGPCHLTVDRTSSFVLVANYASGSLSVLPILRDGGLGEATDAVQHEGSSVDPDRQDGPHAHSITLDPGNRYAFAPDLGIDRVMVYELDLAQGKLRPHDEVQTRAGAGPRHFSFHPTGKYAYLINELDSTLTAFAYDGGSGTLTEITTVSALPEGFEGTSHCADVHVSPSGRFVYGSNRGDDSIVVFEIDERSGRLTYVGHEPTQGETPRNFAVDPTGAFLLAANQNSDTIVVFRIHEQTGKLIPTGDSVEVSEPACLKVVSLST